MTLIKLKLENFQGIRSLELDFEGGQSASIYGDNATGKTTVYNAVTWLLFDRASTGVKNFTPKTRTGAGEAHNLNHSAEATFEADNGRVIRLKKTLHEVYKKKRGSASEEFSGHTVEYEIDGVPAKEKEFSSAVLAYCGGDLERPKMLTMPDYFPEALPWDVRRKILLDVCGDITDDEVIASVPELAELRERYLLMDGTVDQYYSIEQYRIQANARRAAINKQLTELPARIDEAHQAMPDLAGLDEAELRRNIEALEAQRRTLTEERAAAATGGNAAAAVREKIANLRAQLADRRAAHVAAEHEKNEALDEEIAGLRRQLSAARDAADEYLRKAQNAHADAERLEALRTQLVNEYRDVQKTFFDESRTVCPTCGQGLPGDKVAAMRGDFNLRRSKRLEEINARGKREASKDAIGKLRLEEDDFEKRRRDAQTAADGLSAKIADLNARYVKAVPWESTEACRGITAEIDALNRQAENSGEAVSEALRGYDERLRAVGEKIRGEQDKLLQFTVADIQKKRIAELEAQEERLSEEYDDLEHGLYLCDVFTRSKVAKLTDSINGRFRTVRFRLFQEQINGGLREDCEVMVPTEDGRLVPYAFANHAARINAGLEIIDTLARHWGLSMPVFIDNAESVVRLIHTDAQVIRLVVSAADKKLRLEIDR